MKRSGFTLIETLLVLIITAMILSLGFFASRFDQLSVLKHRQFWAEFQSNFILAESEAQGVDHIQIAIVSNDHLVKFIRLGKHKQTKILKIPHGLNPYRNSTITIAQGGYIKPTTFTWYDHSLHEQIEQTFQLGWGVYRLREIHKATW